MSWAFKGQGETHFDVGTLQPPQILRGKKPKSHAQGRNQTYVATTSQAPGQERLRTTGPVKCTGCQRLLGQPRFSQEQLKSTMKCTECEAMMPGRHAQLQHQPYVNVLTANPQQQQLPTAAGGGGTGSGVNARKRAHQPNYTPQNQYQQPPQQQQHLELTNMLQHPEKKLKAPGYTHCYGVLQVNQMIAAGIGPPGIPQGCTQPAPTSTHPGGASLLLPAAPGTMSIRPSSHAPPHAPAVPPSFAAGHSVQTNATPLLVKGMSRTIQPQSATELAAKDILIAQLKNHIAALQEQFLQDSIRMQQEQDQSHEAYSNSSKECKALQKKLKTSAKLLRAAENGEKGEAAVRKLAADLKAANAAREHAIKEAEIQQFQHDMHIKSKVKQLEKEHQADVKSKLDAQKHEMVELQSRNVQLRKASNTFSVEVAALQEILLTDSSAMDDLKVQIAVLGDTLGTKDAELRDARLQHECMKDEVVILKDVLSKMANEKAAAAATVLPAVQNDAYQTHLVAQLKEKNKELENMRDAGEEMAENFRKTRATLARANKEVEVDKAKIESQKVTMALFSKKEESHIKLLHEKDAALEAEAAVVAQQEAALAQLNEEVQGAFADVSDSLDRIKTLKMENAESRRSYNALSRDNAELMTSMRAIEQQLAEKAPETEQQQPFETRRLAATEMYDEAVKEVERLKAEIARIKTGDYDDGSGDVDGGRARRNQYKQVQQIVAENNDLRLAVVDGQERMMQLRLHLDLLSSQIVNLGAQPCAMSPASLI